MGKLKYDKESFNNLLEIHKIHKISNTRLFGEYLGNVTKTKFICKENHIFISTPNSVLNGTICTICSGTKKLTIEEINEKLIDRNIICNDKFIKNSKTKINFKCCNCDHEWKSTPFNILVNKNGCPKCNKYRTSWNKTLINDNLKYRNIQLVGNFINVNEKTSFCCGICKNLWKASPFDVINSTGCPNCSKSGFDQTSPAILYYIKIFHDNRSYYKIGITNKTVSERFKKQDLEKIKIIFEEFFQIGRVAYEKEKKILSEFSKFKYSGNPILSSGNTEIFTKDVFNID